MTDREARDLLFRAKAMLAEASGYISNGYPAYSWKFADLAREISRALVDDAVGVDHDR